MKPYKLRTVDTLLMYALVAVSAIPFFKSPVGVVLILVCILYLHRHIPVVVKWETVLIFLVVFGLEIYHATYFRNYENWVTRQILFFFFIGMFVTYYLKLNYLVIYVRLMYAITLISFVFYGAFLISPGLVKGFADAMPALFTKTSVIYEDVYKQINPVIFNFDYNFYKGRNNGPFWEPTVFASLLLIAQIFNLLLNKVVFNKIGVIFSIGILSTLSTTVFIAYFVLLTSYFLLNRKFKIGYKLTLLVATITTGVYLFANLPFLEEKINTELLNVDKNIEDRGDSRMGSAFLDLNEIGEERIFLLFGKGSSRYSRIGGSDKDALRNCGLTALLIEWGMFFFVLYVGLLYYSFYELTSYFQLNTLFAIPFTTTILLVSFSEVFLDLPFFHSLIFMGLMINRYYKKKVYIPVVIVPEQRKQTPDFSGTGSALIPLSALLISLMMMAINQAEPGLFR